MWTLWASALASPAIVHSHSGGESPHRHGRAENSHHALLHSGASGGFVGSGEAETFIAPAEAHQHGRLLFFGSIRYRPMPNAPADRHGDSLCGCETILTAISPDPGVRVSLSGALGSPFERMSLVDPSMGCVDSAEWGAAACAGAAVPSPLLCDRARHERSGVLLA